MAIIAGGLVASISHPAQASEFPVYVATGVGYGLLAFLGALVFLCLLAVGLRFTSFLLRYRALFDADAAAAAHAGAAGVALYAAWCALILFLSGLEATSPSAGDVAGALVLAGWSIVALLPLVAPLYVILLALYARRVHRFTSPLSTGAPSA